MRSRMDRQRQEGVVLLIALVVLVVLLISSTALIRSFDVSLASAGNLAIKRDLAQQSELAAEQALSRFRLAGTLATPASRSNSDDAQFYSATVLPTNPSGIPLVLVAEPPPANVADLAGQGGVRVRYVVDRLCSRPGDDTALGSSFCILGPTVDITGGSASDWVRAERGSAVAAGGAGAGLAGALPRPVMYRISIRVDGPRNSQSFFQTTFACCGS
jgi:type IV pilus assembly protein PilX